MSYESKPPSIGLWKRDTDRRRANDRGPHASGWCGNIRFVIWENLDKRGDNSPDYWLVLEGERRRDDPPAEKPGGAVDDMPDEEIPF